MVSEFLSTAILLLVNFGQHRMSATIVGQLTEQQGSPAGQADLVDAWRLLRTYRGSGGYDALAGPLGRKAQEKQRSQGPIMQQ